MFARVNQENAIHERQTATAAKNEGCKGLAPKTPGTKALRTPFKISLNDENVTFNPENTGGKGKDGDLFDGGKGGKADANAFLTPAGPRTRAPLGNKTTNAKAGAFRTPGHVPEQLSVKPTSPRLKRGKVKVLHSDATEVKDDASECDIEYMPPREVPLPDHPDDWPHDRTYPQFEGKNFTRGWASEFMIMRDDDEESEMSDFDEKVRELEASEAKGQRQQQQAVSHAAVKAKPVPAKKHPLSEKVPSTLASRQASSALGSRIGGTPSFAAPTASARSKAPGIIHSRKPSTASNPRHTAARAASNTTLGYSKGRSVSAATRRPLGDVYQKPEAISSPSQMPFGGGTTLDQLLGLTLDDHDEEDSLGAMKMANPQADDDAFDDFQLPTPEF